MVSPSKEYDFHSDPEYKQVLSSLNRCRCLDESVFWDDCEDLKRKKDFKKNALEWVNMAELEIAEMRLSIEKMNIE